MQYPVYPTTQYPCYPTTQYPYGTSPTTTSAQTINPLLRGRVISSESDVTPSDVPMDGSASYFPARDGSCIFSKSWNADGTISTRRFVPEQTHDAMAEVLTRLDRIEKSLEVRPRNNANRRQGKEQQDA